MSGNIETARRHVAHTRAVVAEFGFEGFLPGELFCTVEMLAGDPVAAERAVRPEDERLTASGEKGICAGRATFLAEALYEQGRDEEAESLTEAARELAASDDVAVHVLWPQTLAKILTRRGALAEAEQLARDAVELCAKTDWPSDHANALMCLAHVLGTAGRRAEALPLLTEALGLYDQKGNVVGSGRARRQLASLTGHAYRLVERQTEARELWCDRHGLCFEVEHLDDVRVLADQLARPGRQLPAPTLPVTPSTYTAPQRSLTSSENQPLKRSPGTSLECRGTASSCR